MTEDNKSYKRELHRVEQQELNYLKRRSKEKTSLLNAVTKKKIPEKMHDTLEEVFYRSLKMRLEKGTNGLEATLGREKKEARWEENIQHAQILRDSDSLRNLSREAAKDGARSLILSGMTGVGLGIIGVGIPDVAVYSAMLIREVYSHALNYGYHYDSDEEKYFVLLVIRGAFLSGPSLEEVNKKANVFMKKGEIPENTDLLNEIKVTAKTVAGELTSCKFVQGIPLVGVVGGVYDAVYMARLAEFADIKYRKRMLDDYGPSLNAEKYNPVHVIRTEKAPEEKN